jgi:hypothetical protein
LERTRARAKELSPSLILTLLSIVQALALEVLWSSVRDHPFLWEGGLEAAVGWMQVGIALQGIIVVWVAYLGLVVRFVWVPRVHDMVIPFVIGISEFILASALDPKWLVYWLLLLAVMFVFATLSNSSLFLAASELEDNREHFELLAAKQELYGSFSLYGPLAVFVGLILISAVLVVAFGPDSVATLVALALTNGVLVLQFLQIRFYWNRALFAPVENA